MTIYDIAREAGVSIATVSRVMNGGKVGKATRIKVQAVLDSCDYQPSQVAKGLATRQSRCVAVMTVDIRDVHHAAIAYEIERTMATAGYSTILCNLGGTPRPHRRVSAYAERPADHWRILRRFHIRDTTVPRVHCQICSQYSDFVCQRGSTAAQRLRCSFR